MRSCRRTMGLLIALLLVLAVRTHAQQALMLTGRITDAETGAPIRGASITATANQSVARTGPDGTFVAPMPSGPVPVLQLMVSKPGYVREHLQPATVATGRIDVRMRRGAVVVAYVIDESGRPVAGASVSVRCPPSSSANRPTDDRGEARVSGLPPGRCTVRTTRGQVIVRVGPALSPADIQQASELLRDQLAERSRQRAQTLQQNPGVEVDLYAGRETVIAVGEMSNEPAVAILPLPAIGAPPPAGTGLVQGRVTTTNGQPAAGVLVQMSGTSGNRAAVTAADGRYQFAALPAGRFQLGVAPALQLTGLLPAAPPRVIELGDGQAAIVDLGVTRASAITGVVVDEFGEPAEDVPIRISRTSSTASVQSLITITSGSATRTDDRGRYRVAVSPGVYRVAAMISATGQREEPVYFPSTVRLADAADVDVRPELETGGIDIATARPVGLAIRGTVVNAAGRPVERGVALLVEAAGSVPVPTRTQVPIVDGTFEFASVREGQYEVTISAPPAPYMFLTHRNGQVVDSTVPAATEFAQLSVAIEREARQLTVQTGPPSTLRGRVDIEGDDAGLAPTAIRFVPLVIRGQIQPTGVADDWTFRITDLITTTRIGLAALPPGWWLKSFVVNGVDAASQPVDFSGGRGSSNTVRAVIARTSLLSGRVTDAAGEGARGVVVAFPVEADRRFERSPFVRTAGSEANGSYTLNLPPGLYFVAAVPSLAGASPTPAGLPPELAARLNAMARSLSDATMLQLETRSVAVQVREATAVTQDLRLVAAP